MRGIRLFPAVFLFIGLVTVPAPAQDTTALSVLPDDVTLVAEIDVPTFAGMFNEKNRMAVSRRFGAGGTVDVVKYFRTIYVGLANSKSGSHETNAYVVCKGTISAAQLAEIGRSEGKTIRETSIGALKAYYEDSLSSAGSDMFIADAGPGILFIGNKPAIERLHAVMKGLAKNALGNKRLHELQASLPSADGIRIFGYGGAGGISTRHMDAFAAGIGLANKVLDVRLRMVTSDPNTFAWVNAGLAQAASLAPQIDPAGKLAELVKSIVAERTNDGVAITTTIPLSTIEYLNANLEKFAGAAMMAVIRQNAEKRQKK